MFAPQSRRGGIIGVMDKREVVCRIVRAFENPGYLEIGVLKGGTFLRVRARRKVAVDPAFRISALRKAKWHIRNPSNLRARYFEMSSDDFFARNDESFDVIFVDGLHTYAQSLTDVENALRALNPGGVVLVDDCIPHNRASAQVADSPEQARAILKSEGYTGELIGWCGDVYKTICHLRSQRDDLTVFTLKCSHDGIGVVARQPPRSRLHLSPDEIARMTYDDLMGDVDNLLNIKPVSYVDEFLKAKR